MNALIISLGGSLIVPDNAKVDTAFLKKFKQLVLDYLAAHKDARMVIVCGGGKTARTYIEAAQALGITDHEAHDWLGISATGINAQLVKMLFHDQAYEEVIHNPTQKITTKKRILVGAGWKPGCSTDMDAVLLAENLKATTLVNLSNIEYAYDKDPRKFKDAKKVEKASWKDFRKIVGEEWKPGMNTPFDPQASKLAEKLKLKVVIAKGTNFTNVKNILEGKAFKGTLVE
jgi:uridylate kinase